VNYRNDLKNQNDPNDPNGLNGPNDQDDRPVQPVQQEPRFRIRAHYTESTVTVYQAYRPEIGRAAARDGRFPSSWSRDRRTWIIKPRSQTVPLLPAASGRRLVYSTSMP
jgi:hypothetical protein